MTMMSSRPYDQLLRLLATHAYRFSEKPFVLKSGTESNHYVDCRKVLLDPQGRDFAAQLVRSVLELCPGPFEGVAGVVLGGVPLADQVSTLLRLPAVYVRPETKAHGSKNQVEVGWAGGPRAVQRVVLLEDVTTTGGSAERAVKALTAAGIQTVRIIALVNRSPEQLELGAPYTAIFTLDDIIHCRTALDAQRSPQRDLEAL